MKVCLLNDAFAPMIDGVGNVVMNYATHLTADQKADVLVGTPRYPRAKYESYPFTVVPYRSLNTTKLASGYRTGDPLDEKAISKMTAFMPDIIHTHCPVVSTMIARIIREQTGAPVIFTYHTKYDIDIKRVLRFKPAIKEAIQTMVFNIEACDDIWVVSQGAGENLRELGFQGDYHVMPNGVDFEKGKVDTETVKKVTDGYDLPQGTPVFLFVGRIMTYKGLPIILDALKILQEQHIDFRMVFIGKGPDECWLQERIQALGLTSKCILIGPVYDRQQLRAWNTRADLFLFPSTFDTNGLVVREAAACGLASVLIQGSCAAEGIIDGHNGFLIEENAQSMAALLEKINADPDVLQRVGQYAMDEIYLSWEDAVDLAYQRYQMVLEKGPKEKKINPGTILTTMTAKRMQDQNLLRMARKELLLDFKNAIGMMDNIAQSEQEREKWKEAIRKQITQNAMHTWEYDDTKY